MSATAVLAKPSRRNSASAVSMIRARIVGLDLDLGIHGRTLVGGEKVRIENNLSVRYRNQVGRE